MGAARPAPGVGSLFVGEGADGVVLGVIVAMAVGLGFLNEYRAERAAEALHSRIRHDVLARRDGHAVRVDVTDLVPGDVVHLRMGDLSPADVGLLDGGLLVDQSALTGESVPVEAGRGALAFAGARIRRGEATGQVEATGARTYFGKTAELVRTAKATSHLQSLIFSIVRTLIVLDAALVAVLVGCRPSPPSSTPAA